MPLEHFPFNAAAEGWAPRAEMNQVPLHASERNRN
jgi:hypothetical protein